MSAHVDSHVGTVLLKVMLFKLGFCKSFSKGSGGSPHALSPWCPAVLMLILFLHLVEDKVKDQLEAAKPETIIDEVVRMESCSVLDTHLCCFQLSLGVSSSSLGSDKPGPQEARLVSVC